MWQKVNQAVLLIVSDRCWLFMGHTIICILRTMLYFKAVTRIVTEDNSEVSNDACLFLPHHADASWLKNALKVDQSFFHIKVITEFVS